MPTTTTGNGEEMAEVDSMITALQEAIAKGNGQQAKEMAEKLAKHQAKLSINLISIGPNSMANCFTLNVKLESAMEGNAFLAPFPLQVSAGITIYGLKVKMAILYKIPMQCQKWIIGKKIPGDMETLKKLGISKTTNLVYLFVLEPKSKNLDRGEQSLEFETLKKFHDALVHRGLNPDLAMSEEEYTKFLQSQQRPRRPVRFDGHTLSGGHTMFDSLALNEASPVDAFEDPAGLSWSPSNGTYRRTHHGGEDEMDFASSACRSPPPQRTLYGTPTAMPRRNTTPVNAQERPVQFEDVPPPPPVKPTARDVGWSCGRCTFVNPPIIPACRTCLAARPESYKIPEPSSYIMDEDEQRIFLELQQNEMLLEEWEKEEKDEERRQATMNRDQMLQVANQDLITNTEPFDCPVCFTEVEPNEGVTLRECLHQICRECLENHINICNEPEIKCPYTEGEGADCEQVIPDREIKQIIGKDDYERYLQRSVNRAEAAADDSFHCKTPDCPGLCFYDDQINFFDCEVCHHQNCLTCKAIHEGQNCKQYQEDLRIKAGNDEAAKKTHEALQEMVRKGEAMNCPKCGIVIQKKSGCDWMQCSMCKVEICWVTKGPRWGPKGHGDTSGGCRCRVNGKCHPNCGNCH